MIMKRDGYRVAHVPTISDTFGQFNARDGQRRPAEPTLPRCVFPTPGRDAQQAAHVAGKVALV